MNCLNNPSTLDIDPAAIDRFVEVVFGYLDGFVPVRILAETGTPDQKPTLKFPIVGDLAGTLKRVSPFAAQEFRGVYVVPGTVAAPGSAKAEDVTSTGVVLIDLDEGDIVAAHDHLVLCLGLPTMEIASGGRTSAGQDKLHLYWKLTEAASGPDLERVRMLREQIAARVGGDRSFDSLHQPIRVAGTIHGKNGILTQVRLREHRALEYDLADLEEAVAGLLPIVKPTALGISIDPGQHGLSARDLKTRVIRAGAVNEDTRFSALSKIIGHWIRNVRTGSCSLSDAWKAVDDHNAAMISPSWEISKLQRAFEGLVRKDVLANGPMPIVHHPSVPKDQIALSDDAIAASFVSVHGAVARHVSAWGTWFVWSGTHWSRDETGKVREFARQVCRGSAQTAGTPNEARRVASDKTIAAVLRIASCDPTVATRTSDWDCHSMLLNTPAGVIDLETGEVKTHNPNLLLTQITAASLGSGCPRWLTFLNEITGGNSDTQSYLQRLAGYVLTGSTEEQMFAFFHGPGGNGKSVFIQTLGSLLGDYAATATLDTFMATSTSRHLTELAGLRAARLVIVPETEAGTSWAEARIKSVTGGEKIRANFMHRDHFEYQPQFKLIVAGNHRPSLSNVGESMRRRLHLIPFDVTIAPADRDKDLSAKLLAERDGILTWMLDGCAAWKTSGLKPPANGVQAANDYFEDEDLIGQWIDERCSTGIGQKATSNILFASWSTWADAGSHFKGNQKWLGDALRQRGFINGKVGRDRGWFGLCPTRTPPAREDI